MDHADSSRSSPLAIGECAALATLLEATAHKPGNVHRGADFEDVTYPEFVAAGIAIAPVLDTAIDRPLGATILAAVEATRRVTRRNTNLGTILLLAPLAAVPRPQSLADGVAAVLGRLSADDARNCYAAIRLAAPGGLGHVEQADVASTPPSDLLAAMRLAADRDLVARQYAENFRQVFESVVPWLVADLDAGIATFDAIVHVHLRLMSEFPDSLIGRKCGAAVARRSANLAAATLAAGPIGSDAYYDALNDLDFWLRSDGHRRNPGTTADLLAAGLFVLLREGIMKEPLWG
ncbi:MAG TPA: triphosphoribosyl-dephospho-CoA synthase [Pirellulales bacterium]|jgi:triphosphoribosyl-dephospho-CoA synthase|nr:triphosphoribosyl-dephospho-CoA synthase [Pirellulales bacterium]